MIEQNLDVGHRSSIQIDDQHNRTVVEEAIAGIAHQIHQPLYAISNYARACQKILQAGNTEDKDDLLTMLDGIAQAVVRSRDVIQQLRTLAHNYESVRVRVPIAPIIRNAIHAMQDEASNSNTRIEVKEPVNDTVFVDPVQIQHVVMSLVRNAIEAMFSQPVEERVISIDSSLIDEFVSISIQDRGSGLAANLSQNIFDAFVTDKTSRLGMGLAIVRSIVESHGGRICCNRNEGQAGWCFRFGFQLTRTK